MQGLLPLYRYFEFSGRSSRAEYWQWVALTIVAGWITGIADGLNSTPYEPSSKFTMALYAATAIPSLSVGVRRLHDIGKSGWHFGALWGLAIATIVITLIGSAINDRTGSSTYLGAGVLLLVFLLAYAVYIVVLTVKPGNEGVNEYGLPPTGSDAPKLPPQLVERAREIQAGLSTPRTPSRTDADPLAQIERIARMRDAGMLTEEEFQQQKAAYLARMN